MSEDEQAHRFNVHSVMLTSELEMAVVRLQAERELGKTYAVLYGLVEGLFKLGYLGREDYDLLIKRYSRKLVDVTKENREKRENTHVPVLTLEKQREKQFWDQKDQQFEGQLKQWDMHPSPQWRAKILAEAEKFKDKLDSARRLLDLHGKEQACDIVSPSFEEAQKQ